MRKKTAFTIFLVFLTMKIFAQADISMATHWYNRANYNPASISRINYMYLFTNVRQQWVNVTGAPQVMNIQASTYNENMKSAFGISFVSDQIGISQAINPMLSYAYRVDEGNMAVSFGISAGIFSRTYNGSLFDPLEDDPALSFEINELIKPDANIGFEFQTRHFIGGASSTHILSINNADSSYLNSNHRYAYLIYKNTDGELINWYAGLQYVNRSNLSVMEFNGSVRFKHPSGLKNGAKELFDIGLTYRTSKQITLLLGWNISENFRIGYAYDQSLITGFNQNGSHEIMLEYRIPLKSATCIPCMNDNSWYR